MRALLAVFLLLATPAMAADTGKTPLGTYAIALPEGERPATGWPTLLFFHGAGRSGAIVLRNDRVAAPFLAAGFAVVVPDGLKRPGSRFGPGWNFHPLRKGPRDELAFAREVLADAAATHGVDRSNVLAGGFSIGGSLAWYLACRDAGLARAYAPVAGAFWRPHPEPGSCSGPIRMLHTHGWRDETVPLEGRVLRGGALKQGDVFHSLELQRVTNGCTEMRADAYATDGPFWRRRWDRCTEGSALEFALHTRGHFTPQGWAEMAIDWFRALP